VLTYPDSGVSMQALGGGQLVIHNGCIAVADSADGRRPTYVLWPDGYVLIHRNVKTAVLIDPVGTEIARLGETVTLVGGYNPLENADPVVISGIPATAGPAMRGTWR
jgi:hypothetical protein